jgi:hypothetical protein
MSLTDDNTNSGSASAPAPTPYVFLIIAFVLQFLGLAIDLDMLDMFRSYRSLVNMVSLISMFLAIFCLLFSWSKYHGSYSQHAKNLMFSIGNFTMLAMSRL